VQEYQRFFLPNDPGFNQQWHLHNTGQGRGNPAADVDAPEAWELERGSADIVIAIIDNGVQIEHPDLATNIFTNPREIPGNGIDDDGNGYVDDVHGWDFAADDNDPRPSAPDDNHGTAVAGVAAAVGNNGIGVSGVCPNCKILPVKINFVSDAKLAEAIRYAASLADVLNNSWGGGAPSPVIQSAIRDATTTGRGGKGAVVLFAAGNSASGHQPMMLRGLPAGTHRFIWEYLKDGSVNAGDDTAWLAWVVFPGGTWVDLRNPLPGWRTGGHALWALVHDPAHTDEGLCLTRAAKAGRITHGQRTFLEVVKQVPAGDFVSMAWVSSEGGYDGLVMAVDLFNDGWIDGYVVRSGVPRVTPRVSYPAAHPEAIAVGASTNFDCRAAYSQFGPELDFVAPSNGGPTNPINLGIVTTDRTGSAGYDSQSDYTTGFGGTSSATPLAAGVVGLMLSHHPNLPQEEVRRILHQTANKIGPEPYDVTGRNDRYGFGRINAFKAVAAAAEAVAVPPGVATLLAPLDGMTNATPTYTWAAVPGAERYHLWVSDSTGKRISQRYRAEQAGCADGSGTCSVTSDVVLAEGAGRWQVRALNGVSTGPWSTPRQFTVQAQ
jgi:subtilisin family serine protease